MTGRMQETTEHLRQWLLQEKHRQRMRQWRKDLEKAFTEHPRQTGESYLQHLWFTVKMSARFLTISLVLTTHGLFPFLFTRATSNQLDRIYLVMKGRVPKPAITSSLSRIFKLRKTPPEPTHRQRIGVIGGGFSGMLTVTHLVRSAQTPLIIEWFDEGKTLGTGIAYSTEDDCHLLNARADRMGAVAGKPEGFYFWLQSEEGKVHAARLWPSGIPSPESYAPRKLYSVYLQSIRDETLQIAQAQGIEVRIHQATATDAMLTKDGQLALTAETKGTQEDFVVDVLVLATGNLPPRQFAFQPGMIRGVTHYIANIWNPQGDCLYPHQVNQLSADAEIVIIGTGLTMVDSVLTLKKNGYKGTITAISRHGWLPAVHTQIAPYPQWEWTRNPAQAPAQIFIMLKQLRREIKKAAASGYDWRSVIDSLRPVTQTLWKRLSITEKRKFITRLFTLWSIHRHRMAPEINTQIKSLQQNGTLRIVPGRIYYVGSDEEGLTVAYRKRGANRLETIRAALVLNCTGPEHDIAASSHRLLKNLRDRKLISVDSLRMGISTTETGSAEGKTPDLIFPVGTLLVGELLECTAVPELREQTHAVANAVTERLREMREMDIESLGAWI